MSRKLSEVVRVRSQGGEIAGSSPPSGEAEPLLGQVLTWDGYPDIALVDLGQDISDALRASWANPDRPFQSGGIMDSAWLPGLLGVGGTAADSVRSCLSKGQLFVATANVDDLVRSKAGGYLATMRDATTGRFTQSAPFVPATAGQSVLASIDPTMLSVAVSSAVIVARLNRMEKELGKLSAMVERMRQLLEAEDYARFETAAEQINEIQSEFEHHGRFASDVNSRLSLVDRDVNLLRHKYGRLATRDIRSPEDAQSVVVDLNRFYLSSLHDVRIDVLQLCLALQDDSAHVAHRQTQLLAKVERYREDFKKIVYDDRVGAFHRRLKGDLAKSRWNYVPGLARGLKAKVRNFRKIRKDFHSARARIERWIDAFDSTTDESRAQSIVIYQELEGERALRAYYTSDLQLQRVNG